MCTRIIISFAFFSLLAFTACSKKTESTAAEKQAVRAVLESQEQAWNRGDLEGYMAGYLRSDSLRFASGGRVRYGWQATLGAYRRGYPDREAMGELSFDEVRITLLSDTTAMVFGHWRLERNEDHPEGLFTLIFRKTEGGWRIIHDHTSSAR